MAKTNAPPLPESGEFASPEAFQAWLAAGGSLGDDRGGRNKYGAEPCTEDGHRFASRKERRHYRDLKLRLLAGEIADLAVHPAYDLVVNGEKVGRFTLDFRYRVVATGAVVVVDVKGGRATKTEAYGLRKKLLKALYGLDVTEV